MCSHCADRLFSKPCLFCKINIWLFSEVDLNKCFIFINIKMENLISSWFSFHLQEEKEFSRAKVFDLHLILCPTSRYTAEAWKLNLVASPGSLAARILDWIFASDIHSCKIWLVKGMWKASLCRDGSWQVTCDLPVCSDIYEGTVLVVLVRAGANIGSWPPAAAMWFSGSPCFLASSSSAAVVRPKSLIKCILTVPAYQFSCWPSVLVAIVV